MGVAVLQGMVGETTAAPFFPPASMASLDQWVTSCLLWYPWGLSAHIPPSPLHGPLLPSS